MGLIIAKFRKKKTTYELLEVVDNKIKVIEEFSRSTQQTQKKAVARFIFFSITLCISLALIFYWYFLPTSIYHRVLYIVPLAAVPFLLFFIKHAIIWYYTRKLIKNEMKLIDLKVEKQKILDEVMDKETYNVAKTILERFAPEQVIKRTSTTPLSKYNITDVKILGSPLKQTSVKPEGNGPRQRFQSSPLTVAISPTALLSTPPTQARLNAPQNTGIVAGQTPRMQPQTPSRTLPRAVLPRHRSYLDKIVDYLVDDGPSNRFAMICRVCAGHNGMALKEEFEYLSFRCCYCATLNPSRKKRPIAPKLLTNYYESPNNNKAMLEVLSPLDETIEANKSVHTDEDDDKVTKDSRPAIGASEAVDNDGNQLEYSRSVTDLRGVGKVQTTQIKEKRSQSCCRVQTTTTNNKPNVIED